MKKSVILLLLSFSFIKAGQTQSVPKSYNLIEQYQTHIIQGKFILDSNSTPIYAGYGTNKNDPSVKCSQELNRKIASNELLFKIVGFIKNDSQKKSYQRKKWLKFNFSELLPYDDIKNLHEGDSLTLHSSNNTPFTLTVMPKSPIGTFQEILHWLLSKSVISEPKFFSYDADQLVKDEILIEEKTEKNKKQRKKYCHGPNGFDFSVLDDQKAEKVELYLLNQKNKNEN